MRRRIGYIVLLFFLASLSIAAEDEPLGAGGTVSGQITDESRRPVEGASVRMLMLDSHGRYLERERVLQSRSDASGRYKITDVPAGDYMIAVQYSTSVAPDSATLKNRYFPGVLLPGDARAVRVGPRAVLTAMDVSYARGTQGFLAQGRVIDAVSKKPVGNTQLLYGEDFSNPRKASARSDAHTDADGVFALRDLSPGRYWVAIDHARSGQYYCYPTYFEISNDDVSGMEITVRQGVTLSGTVALDPGISPEFFLNTYAVFHPSGISQVNQHGLNGLVDQYLQKKGAISRDGRFSIQGVPPITGTLSLKDSSGQSRQDYLIRIRRDAEHIGRALLVRNKDIPNIVITVTEGKGTLRGTVRCTGGILDMDRAQVLISLVGDQTVFFSKNTTLDAAGRFTVDGLVPGEYRVMVTLASPDGRRIWRIGPVFTANIRNGAASEIDLPVPGE